MQPVLSESANTIVQINVKGMFLQMLDSPDQPDLASNEAESNSFDGLQIFDTETIVSQRKISHPVAWICVELRRMRLSQNQIIGSAIVLVLILGAGFARWLAN
jgi:hypothetical protein